MSATDWLVAWLVLVTAYVVAQGISILLYRPKVIKRNSPSAEELRKPPRRQATWASGVRSSRREDEEE